MGMIEITQFTEAKSEVLESSHAIYTLDDDTPITILEAEGFNDSATNLYWQIHGGRVPPSTGTPSLHSIRVNAGQTFYWQPMGGFRTGFRTDLSVDDAGAGIWCASTTPVLYTPGPAAFWVLVKYLAMHQALLDA
jgi:hypothetical protein